MKRVNYLLVLLAALSFTMACKNVNYKKTKSGLLYKIFPGNGKDPLIKNGQIVKYQVMYKLNDDSVLYTSYGKAPAYDLVKQTEPAPYNMSELFPLMKKGDSAVTVQLLDTLIRRGSQIPFPTNKGDRLITHFSILEVFASDSLARPDYEAEMEKDKPRQMKEQEEQMAKKQKQEEAQQLIEMEKLEKSGEIAKELKEMEAWLAAKKIKAQKTGKGTYVYIKEQGTGPVAELGKYVNVKYSGKVLATDSVFQSSSYAFKLGTTVIRGWTEGLQLFKQGGKGTIYIPGFLAYGPNPGPAAKPYAPLLFDVEILEVSDKPIAQQQQPGQ
jgi:FKBP-type peptidyl-prolyl cis-trans isomerase FkpA